MTGGNNESKTYVKNKAAEFRADLKPKSDNKRTVRRTKETLKKILANVTMANNEMVMLFPEIIDVMAESKNLEIKKLCYLFLTHYGKVVPERANEALQVLLKDFSSNGNAYSSSLRSLALRTMAYINIDEYNNAVVSCCKKAINDRDAYVRKTVAYCVAKVWDHAAKLVENSGLIQSINELIEDENPMVVCSALAALTDITEKTAGMKLTLDKNASFRIARILPDCNEWNQSYILTALMSYTPETIQDAAALADEILPRLQHSNTAVVLGSIRVILYLMNYMNDNKSIQLLYHRFGPPLVSLLSKPPELQFVLLRNCFLLVQTHPEIFEDDITVFFCKYYDPSYIKNTKLEIVFLLTNKNNYKLVLQELEEYATEIDVHFVRKAVRAIGKLAIKIDQAADRCVDSLMDLAQTRITYIVQEVVISIQDILRRYPNRYESIIPKLCERVDSLDDPDAKSAIIWIVGQYANRIADADKLISDFLVTFKDDPLEVQLTLLTATVKLFIQRPSKSKELVPKVLKWATEESDNPDLRDRGYMYWRMLSTNPIATKKIIMGEKPTIKLENERFTASLLEELSLNMSTIISIYLKPPQQIFRGIKQKQLKYSPALNKSVSTRILEDSSTQRQVIQAPKRTSSLPKALGFDSTSTVSSLPQPSIPTNLIHPNTFNSISPLASPSKVYGNLNKSSPFSLTGNKNAPPPLQTVGISYSRSPVNGEPNSANSNPLSPQFVSPFSNSQLESLGSQGLLGSSIGDPYAALSTPTGVNLLSGGVGATVPPSTLDHTEYNKPYSSNLAYSNTTKYNPNQQAYYQNSSFFHMNGNSNGNNNLQGQQPQQDLLF